jgi:aspartyl/asparaginyl-tRNA synthetase
LKRITVGAAISVSGILTPSLGQGQTVEIPATTIEILGDCDPEAYPIQPKKHSLEFLRENAHLRFRTNTFGAIFRVRNTLSFAIHQFLQERGFVYLHTPVITASDAEGAGETFQVTTLDLKNIPFVSAVFDNALANYLTRLKKHIDDNGLNDLIIEINRKLLQIITSIIFSFFEKNNINFIELISADESQVRKLAENKELFALVTPAIKKLYVKVSKSRFFIREEIKITTKRDMLEGKEPVTQISNYLPKWFHESIIKNIKIDPKLIREHVYKDFPFLALNFYNIKWVIEKLRSIPSRNVDYSKDFFNGVTNLTVSGQLEGELGAMALSDIYTFGPTFRAENSNTTRHLAEFWMIEPEMAFYDLKDNADLAEAMLKYVISYALDKNRDDLEFLSQRLADEEKQKPQNERSEMSLLDKLQFCLDNDFVRITYTEAIDILRESSHNKKKKFQYLIEGWGADLQSEHERYLVEKHFKKPVVLTDYPKEIKSFYMRQNEDGKTVAAMDILFPGIGEIIGGSQREERLDKLEQRMYELGIPKDELWWYLDTRRFGTCPHAGFGLGFERLVLFVTGMGNIRDVIPFPRFPKNAEF